MKILAQHERYVVVSPKVINFYSCWVNAYYIFIMVGIDNNFFDFDGFTEDDLVDFFLFPNCFLAVRISREKVHAVLTPFFLLNFGIVFKVLI